MNSLTKVMVSPHIHSGKSTSGIMRDVLIALIPATVAGAIIFGLRALLIIAVCITSCIIFEAIFNIITKKPQTIKDMSASVTGLLLALNLPVSTPVWQCIVGCLFAIVVVKCIFGGIGNNLVNPAITARVFMLVAFSSLAVAGVPTDAVSSASPLVAEQTPSLMTLFLGNYAGCIGETCTATLLAGAIYLIARKVITWHIPTLFIGTVFVFSLFMEGFDPVIALSLTMAGGVFIGAIFMATDYVTSPYTALGKVIFAIGAGLITCLIRYFGTYPEGVSFAILLMNILNPYINRLTRHRVFAAERSK